MVPDKATLQTSRSPANTNIRDLIGPCQVASVLAEIRGELGRGITPNRALWRAAARALVLAGRWGLLPPVDERKRA
jgi:hypothetical protein